MTKRNGMGWDELDIWEKTTRNVRADTMAKEALQYWVDSGRQRISTSHVHQPVPMWWYPMDNLYFRRNNHIEDPE